MNIFASPVIQVAGVRNRREAAMLAGAGVDLIGFPLGLDVHREDVPARQAAEIARVITPPCAAVVITYLDDVSAIADLCRQVGADIVQLHGPVARTTVERLRAVEPRLVIIKSIVIRPDTRDIARDVETMSHLVDAFITDTFDPATGASGATGKTHNWALSRRVVESTPRPVILAGGLTADNVGQAIATVQPAGVDVHTGVEDDAGDKDAAAVAAFVQAARAAFRQL